ncbi:helix-turn-helix domain-containing protein [Pleomorphomonas sp. NRK KF1]|uniref:helix-turn-helix domain-containing protein n=1 Tax=Pleomorphomonas sp. NRK KF1 TaxID=2943000 RepID=UPI0020444DA4|nr:helix-turn-helix domain-containing protein [Pleomorphomonas sp. NRK KF1]MCM5555326.1 helix-turn-helix domain-containing protein [Pleomorphomonas sp. NRK KF1]
MSQTSSIAPLSWPRLVEEALRRRKAEGLTQKDHAALAGVSHPTMAAFERGETTLTLAKAMDILRVVGLVDEPSPEDAQSRFVREAFERWQALVAPLAQDAPARFPNGWYRIDYWLEGDLRTPDLAAFERLLEKLVVKKGGWPVFWAPAGVDTFMREGEGVIECWWSPPSEDAHNIFDTPDFYTFWSARTTGRMVLMRGYEEDGAGTFPAGAILDTTLPIWRMGEVLLHAERLASLLKKTADSAVTVHFRALYTGLSGRVLRSWANPLSDLVIQGHAARSDEAELQAEIPAADIEGRLAEHLLPLTASLYERFGVAGLSLDRVKAEVERLKASSVR